MRIKLFFIALAAALAMTVASSAGTARNLSISHGELFNTRWGVRFRSGGAVVDECSLTMEGSFHYRTMPKVRETLIGYITRAMSQCSGDGFLTETLPWHIRYESFEGTLPDITGLRIRLIGVSIRVQEIVSQCLIRSSVFEPWIAAVRLTSGNGRRLMTAAIFDSSASMRCGIVSLNFEGTGRLSEVPGGSENLLVRLI
jgi:hypothetical protein